MRTAESCANYDLPPFNKATLAARIRVKLQSRWINKCHGERSDRASFLRARLPAESWQRPTSEGSIASVIAANFTQILPVALEKFF